MLTLSATYHHACVYPFCSSYMHAVHSSIHILKRQQCFSGCPRSCNAAAWFRIHRRPAGCRSVRTDAVYCINESTYLRSFKHILLSFRHDWSSRRSDRTFGRGKFRLIFDSFWWKMCAFVIFAFKICDLDGDFQRKRPIFPLFNMGGRSNISVYD